MRPPVATGETVPAGDTPLLPIAVLAGGLGTRLGDVARDRPKALVPVAGEPFIYHQLRLLAGQGARRVVLCVGHLGEQIEDAVGDGRRFGVEVVYASDGAAPIGTARALGRALPLLGEAFLVTYGDAFLRIDHSAVQRAFEARDLPALMTVLRNDGAWGDSNAVYANGLVTAYDKRALPVGARWIDYGLLAFDSDVFAKDGPPDLSDVCSDLASRGRLGGFVANERFYEIGTPAGLEEVDMFLRSSSTGV